MLLVWWSHIVFTSASKDADAFLLHKNATNNSTDLNVSSQYNRPYYFNRRPSYPANNNGNNRRPVYPTNYRPNYGNNQRPNYYPASQATTRRPNYYPAAPTASRPTTTKERLFAQEAAYTAGYFCNSAEAAASSQGPRGICWDSRNQKLKIDPNLTIENFVYFYSGLQLTRSLKENTAFRDEICEQSRGFNNVAIICVPYKRIDYDSSYESETDVECPTNARKTSASCFGQSCICYLDQYHRVAVVNLRNYFHLFTKQLLDIDYINFVSTNFPAWMLPYTHAGLPSSVLNNLFVEVWKIG